MAYNNFIAKVSKNAYKIHSFSKEWKVAITIAFIAKLFTVGFSLFAGFFFLYRKFLPVLNSNISAIITAVIALALLEGMTNVFLSKFFKFLFRKQIATTAAVLVALFFTYSLSFYSSCEGLAMRQSEKVDNSLLIVESTNFEADQIKKEAAELIDYYKKETEIVKTNSWKGRLNTKQLNMISTYNKNIQEIRQRQRDDLNNLKKEQKMSLENNDIQTTSEANEYYKLIAIIMLVQIFANFFLMLSYSRIYTENDRKEVFSQDIELLKEQLISTMWSTLKNESADLQNHLLDSFAIKNLMYDNKNYVPLEITNKKQTVGFQIQKNDNETQLNNDTPTTNDTTPRNDMSLRNNKKDKICPVCHTPFKSRNYRHTFCSNKCRIHSWEQKTGVSFSKKKE